jgi:hypothetical protein
LNSLWGKLSQRANSTEVIFTKSAQEFHNILADPQREIIDVAHLNECLDRLVVRKKEQFAESPATNNVVIASFVTSHGRRRLYEFIMEAVKKGHTILYCDTDSLVIKRKKNQASLAEGWQKIFEIFFLHKNKFRQFFGGHEKREPPSTHHQICGRWGEKLGHNAFGFERRRHSHHKENQGI